MPHILLCFCCLEQFSFFIALSYTRAWEFYVWRTCGHFTFDSWYLCMHRSKEICVIRGFFFYLGNNFNVVSVLGPEKSILSVLSQLLGSFDFRKLELIFVSTLYILLLYFNLVSMIIDKHINSWYFFWKFFKTD